jgi:3-oxoacyl-[acyl-carrier protein] reductase
MTLSGKVAIVTGGGTGIGKGISHCLAKAGAKVVIAQPLSEKVEETAREIQSEGLAVITSSVDISQRAQVQEMVDSTIQLWGKVDLLVNNASITGLPAISPFLDCSDQLLNQIVDVNLKGTFICSQEVARKMVKSGGGVIINISSVAAFAAQEGASAYCATKAAVVGLTKAMALELAPYGIRVNCIAPGDIATEANQDLLEQLKQRGISGHYFRKIPISRRGEPKEIGRVVAFLASDDSSYITGTTLIVDGGFLIY